jgi:hypothetical protein
MAKLGRVMAERHDYQVCEWLDEDGNVLCYVIVAPDGSVLEGSCQTVEEALSTIPEPPAPSPFGCSM